MWWFIFFNFKFFPWPCCLGVFKKAKWPCHQKKLAWKDYVKRTMGKKDMVQTILHLSMKQGSLFCFVCHAKISQTMVLHLHSWCLQKALDESRGALIWFETLWSYYMWKLLIIEAIFQWKLNKIETDNCNGIWGCSCCCWKALSELDLIEFISQFSELRCGRYWLLSGFCCWKFKQIAKIGFGRKNQLTLNVFTLLNFFFKLFWKVCTFFFIWNLI